MDFNSKSKSQLPKGTIVIDCTLANLDIYDQVAREIYPASESVIFRIKKCSLLDIYVPLVPNKDADDMSEAACLFCEVCKKVIRFSAKDEIIESDQGYECKKCNLM